EPIGRCRGRERELQVAVAEEKQVGIAGGARGRGLETEPEGAVLVIAILVGVAIGEVLIGAVSAGRAGENAVVTQLEEIGAAGGRDDQQREEQRPRRRPGEPLRARARVIEQPGGQGASFVRQTIHGAPPRVSRFSSACKSLKVSMQRQNPSYSKA